MAPDQPAGEVPSGTLDLMVLETLEVIAPGSGSRGAARVRTVEMLNRLLEES